MSLMLLGSCICVMFVEFLLEILCSREFAVTNSKKHKVVVFFVLLACCVAVGFFPCWRNRAVVEWGE